MTRSPTNDQAIAINPKDFNAFNSRGKAWAAKGDRSQAIADFTQAIQLAVILFAQIRSESRVIILQINSVHQAQSEKD